MKESIKGKELQQLQKKFSDLESSLKELQNSSQQFKNMFDHAPIGIFHISPEGKVYRANKALTSMLHYDSIDQFISKINKSSFQETHYANEEDHFRGFSEILLDDRWHCYEIPLKTKIGDINTVELSLRSVKNLDGEVEYLEGFVRDITPVTERKDLEEALRESKTKFRNLVETIPDILWEINSEAIFTYISPQCQAVTGYSPEEIIGQPFIFMVQQEYLPEIAEILNEHFQKGEHHLNFEMQAQHKNGNKIVIEIRALELRDNNGQLTGFRGIARDITENKMVEEEIKKVNIYNRSLIETSLDPLVTIGPDGKIKDVNYATEVITGYSRMEIIGTDFSDYFTNPEEARLSYGRVFREGMVKDYPLEIQHKSGNITSVLYNASIYRDESGKVIGVVAAARDITRRKMAENDIKASLHQKELLLQEIHHRVKNNLQIISSLLNLQEKYVEDEESVSVLQESKNRVLSMAMIHEMLYDSEDLRTINFFGYIQHLVYILFNSYGVNTNLLQLHLNVDEIYLNIETAVPCGLIISELVSNSLKYAFPGERHGNLSIDFHLENDDEFQLIIEDDGAGIPDDVDFRSTDSLGLRLVNSLVNQLDGTIELDSSRGTKFVIKFKELVYRKRV